MECQHCNKTFKNVNLHISKAHKRDMWKFVIPKKYTDEAKVKLYSFGKQIGSQSQSGSGGGTGVDYMIYGFSITPTNTIKSEWMELWVTINKEDDLLIESSLAYYFVGKESHPTLIDKLNYTIEYEE